MKRTPLLLTLGSILLLGAGVVVYQFFLKQETVSAWDFVPDQTVLVYEVGDCVECLNKLENGPIGALTNSLFLDFASHDSLKNTFDFLHHLKPGSLVSLHVTSKNDFDIVYYIPSGKINQFDLKIDSWKKIRGAKIFERELNGSKIHELTFQNRTFSWTQIEGIWIGSFTPFLIEDVVRTSRSDKKEFFSGISGVYVLPKIRNDPGNIYVHLENFVHYLSVFTSDNSELIKTLGQATMLDLKTDDLSVTLNGFSLVGDNQPSSVLTSFKDQSPTQFTSKRFVPNRTLFATVFGISDGGSFFKNVRPQSSLILDSLASLSGADFTKLFSSLKNELTICYEESKNSEFSKILLFDSESPNAWLDVFDKLSKASEHEDTIFYERYSVYEIREIEISDLPEKIFHPVVQGFQRTYYTSIGNTIVLADRLEELKLFLDDIDREDVWGKSVSVNRFLESTLLESNVSIYINTPLVWNSLLNRVNQRWRTFITENQPLLKTLDFGAIQFSNLNESFYTNITWTFSATSFKPSENQQLRNKQLIASLPSAITLEPFVGRSHVSKQDEAVVQDSLNVIYHLASDGKILWSKPLGRPIVGKIQQVDFFNNGKLQFFFCTADKLHVIDRLGKYVQPFPVDIRVKDPLYVSVVDYDKSKKYRFLVAEKSGKLWMFDKAGLNLDGWKPRHVEGELFAPARHHRIRGKDYLVAIRKDGVVYLMNRRGENLKGFPLKLDGKPVGDYFLEIGSSTSTSYFVCVTRDGYRIKFNLDGKVLSKETLVKPSFETQFSLVPEIQRKSYLITRQDNKRLTILDDEAKELLSNYFIGSNTVDVKYYDFGAGRVYIVVTDLVQELTYLYNGKGDLLTSPPIEGRFMEVRPSKLDYPSTFVVDGNTLIIQ